MTEQKSIVQVRNEIRRFHEAAREVLEQTNLDVVVRKRSDEDMEYFRSRQPKMRWLARLPGDRREAVRRMWETHERLANLIRAAVRAAPKGTKAQLKGLADGVLGELEWIVLPSLWTSGERPDCYEPMDEATVEPPEPEIDDKGRLTVLDEQIAKLDVLLEEAEAAGMKAFSLSPRPTVPRGRR